MELAIFQVDAFTHGPFTGNPAAVVLLVDWLGDRTLQSIAQQNNLSETAFLVPLPSGAEADYQLRWFTPTTEVDLCGHATLASAQVVLEHLAPDKIEVSFSTKAGRLRVEREEGKLTLSLPVRKARPELLTRELCDALRARPREVLKALDLMAIFPSAAQVRALRPDFEAISLLPTPGVIVTGPGADCDFVSRYFAPREGVPEDPVTGSAHCTLVPYWAKRLKKDALHARQVSDRGGELFCRLRGDQVLLSGCAVTYLKGTIFVGPVQAAEAAKGT